MKPNRYLCALLALVMCVALLSACGKESPNASAESGDSVTSEPAAETAADTGIDVDLTSLGSTMVYAEVYNMMTEPDGYIGKRVRVSGPYNPSFYDGTQEYYHFVMVTDAAACCQQGLEFVWSGEHTYPDDYPEAGATVEITGEFGSYEELGVTYYCIFTDEVNVVG